MKQYKLVALSETGASTEYSGDTIESCKEQFSKEFDNITEFTARIYDHFSGALIQVKPLGILNYSKA